ncbi:MAG: GT4 family glycosyltransferase PelF, partial [Acidihalobacter sp.]
RFAAVFLGSQAQDYGGIQYQLPDNLVALETLYLFDQPERRPVKPPRLPADTPDLYARLHASLRAGNAQVLDFGAHLESGDPLNEEAFLYGEPAWRYITAAYEGGATEPSFVDYFWTVRNLHRPIWALARATGRLPRARLFLSPSTGYAGLLGVLGAQAQQRPFVLMEHGIYTKERKIDLAQAEWIQDTRETLGTAIDEEASYIRRLWIHFFEGLGRLAYASASPIVSLYEGNRQRQLADGAAQDRTQVVPNGIDLPRFSALRESRPAGVPPVVGLIGRVVPIKDIKTFIRAMHSVCTQHPQAEGWIVGPEDEDAEYVHECRDLVENLGLAERVRFLGFRRVDEILPQLGVLVLTSISEALPLVVLEGFAAGVPAVTTDVGSCSELIEGSNEADRAIGVAGELVPIASPEDTARAILRLLDNPVRWEATQRAGIERVERFYTQTDMFQAYRDIYETALAEGVS